MPPPPTALVRAALDSAAPGSRPDGWAPSVQGAVGHVVGVRGPDGSPLVLKLYPGPAGDRWATEVRALALLADVPGVRVPRVVAAGEGPAPLAGYLLMSRLAGVRWADRRADTDGAAARALASEAGRVLRAVHRVRGPGFGGLHPGAPSWPTAWDRVAAELPGVLAAAYPSPSGDPHDGDARSARVRDAVLDRRGAFHPGVAPVLCHRDLTDGNLLVEPAVPPGGRGPASGYGPAPRVVGVVDLERATWDDPAVDLALTRAHVRAHAPGDVDAVLDGYGPVDDLHLGERVAVHELLHAVRERAWVAHDRPHGWRRSVARLDALVASWT